MTMSENEYKKHQLYQGITRPNFDSRRRFFLVAKLIEAATEESPTHLDVSTDYTLFLTKKNKYVVYIEHTSKYRDGDQCEYYYKIYDSLEKLAETYECFRMHLPPKELDI